MKYLYLDKDTFFHRLDPRTKLLILLVHYIVITVLVSQLYLLALILIEVIALAVVSKSMPLVYSLRYVLYTIAVSNIVFWTIFGSKSIHLWGIFYVEPLGMGTGAALRNVIGIMISLVLLATTRNEELVAGLVKLGLPYRAAFAFSSALRMAPVLINVSLLAIAAQKSRGLDVESGNFFQKIKKYIPLITPAFLITMRQTDQFTQAVESKGFGCSVKRTSYLQLTYSKQDKIFQAVTLIFGLVFVIISVLKWCAVFTPLS